MVQRQLTKRLHACTLESIGSYDTMFASMVDSPSVVIRGMAVKLADGNNSRLQSGELAGSEWRSGGEAG